MYVPDSVDGCGCSLPLAVAAGAAGGDTPAAVGGSNFGGCGFQLVEDGYKTQRQNPTLDLVCLQ